MKILQCKLTTIEAMLGTASNNKELHSEFIASHAPDAPSREEEIAADVMAVLLCCFNPEGIIACLAQARAEGRKSRGARERKEQLRELIDYCGFVRVMAFKSRRIDNEENPTDWTREQAEEFLASFTGELILQIYASLRDWEAAQTLERMEKKLERWAKRLKGETADGEREGVLLDKGAN